MDGRQPDGVADFLLRQLQVEAVGDAVIRHAQPVENVEQEGRDARLCRSAAQRGKPIGEGDLFRTGQQKQ